MYSSNAFQHASFNSDKISDTVIAALQTGTSVILLSPTGKYREVFVEMSNKFHILLRSSVKADRQMLKLNRNPHTGNMFIWLACFVYCKEMQANKE